MRFVIEVRIEDGDHPLPPPVTVGVIERSADLTPASGLGLFLQETKDLLRELQAVVVAGRIDSSDLLPTDDPLPHVTCYPPDVRLEQDSLIRRISMANTQGVDQGARGAVLRRIDEREGHDPRWVCGVDGVSPQARNPPA